MWEDVWGLAWMILNKDVWEHTEILRCLRWNVMLSTWAIFSLYKRGRHASFPSGFSFHPLPILSILNKQLYDFRISEHKLSDFSISGFFPRYIYAVIMFLTTTMYVQACSQLSLIAWCESSTLSHISRVQYCQHVCLCHVPLCYTTSQSEWPLFSVWWFHHLLCGLLTCLEPFGTRLNSRIINLSAVGWQCFG